MFATGLKLKYHTVSWWVGALTHFNEERLLLSDSVPVGVCFHQECILSPVLFILFKDRISRSGRWRLLGLVVSGSFAYNVVSLASPGGDL